QRPLAARRPQRRRTGTQTGRDRTARGGAVMSAKFKSGEQVRVRAAFPPGHVRTPFYIRGKSGVVERVLDAFPNPEELAFGPGRVATPLAVSPPLATGRPLARLSRLSR